MRAFFTAILIAAAGWGWGCGSAGKASRCSADVDCGANRVCAAPVAGEEGVCIPRDSNPDCALKCGGAELCGKDGACQARYQISLAVASDPALVNANGVGVTAKVTRYAVDSPEPTVALSSGEALVKQGASADGLSFTYSGTYHPAPDLEAAVSLTALAGAEGLGQNQSDPAAVQVDTLAPRFGTIDLACGGHNPCLRDDLLGISAEVTDAHLASVAVEVAVPGHPEIEPLHTTLQLNAASSRYERTAALTDLPFPFLSQPVSVIVTALDAVQNQAGSVPATRELSRKRWVYPSDTGPSTKLAVTTPVVLPDPDGNLVIGTATASGGELVKLSRQTGEVIWTTAPGSIGGAVTAAPAASRTGVWAGAENGVLYLVDPATGAIQAERDVADGDPSGSKITTTPVVMKTGSVETAFVGSWSSLFLALESGGQAASKDTGFYYDGTTYEPGYPFLGPAAISGTHIFAANGFFFYEYGYDPGTHTISDTIDPNSFGLLSTRWWNIAEEPAPIATSVNSGFAWTAEWASGGTLARTPAAGRLQNFTPLDRPATEAVFVGTDELVVGNVASTAAGLRRIRLAPKGSECDVSAATVSCGSWTYPWTGAGKSEPVLDGEARTPILLNASGSRQLLVPTKSGSVTLVDAEGGSVLWSFPVASAALLEGNVAKGPGDLSSTAYFGSADGKVYALIVDGDLDATSSWPKARHDPQNTGNTAWPWTLP